MTKTNCGFVGLGSQGAPIARRMIDAGYPTKLWARRPESLQAFRDTPAELVGGLEELATAEHVGICVVDDAGVQEVCATLIPAMRPGARILIHSTVHPDLCRSLAGQAAARGIAVIDAPVSGGAPAAAAGKMTVMVGGDRDAFEAAKPILQTFGSLISYLGGVGSGQLAKLVNNAMMAAHAAIAHHALTAAEQLKIDRTALVELIKASSGRSFGFENYAGKSTITDFAQAAKLLDKDVRLLGEALAPHPAFDAFRELTSPFLARAMGIAGNAP